MKDINLMGLNNIKADKELIERTVNKVMNNNKSKNYFNIKKSVAVAASLMVIVGTISFYSLHTKGDLGKEVASNTTLNNKVTPEKTVIAKDMKTDKVVAYSKVVSNKTLENTNKTSIQPVLYTKGVASMAVPKHNVTKGKAAKNITPPISNVVVDNNAITIPQIDLNSNGGTHAKMLALVVYNGKIYLQSNTELDSKDVKSFLGEKIGRTINSINEWNVKDKSTQEMASNIGEQDIYTVKGYDNSFRIMSYSIYGGQGYAQFFDCLNGITVKSGKDIFGKLNLVNNIESAKFTGFDGWNGGTNSYTNFSDVKLLNEVIIELNSAVPYDYQTVGNDIDASKNDNEFREFTLKLKDGLEVKFNVFKNGYVSYGYSNIYFKVDNSVIDKLWQ